MGENPTASSETLESTDRERRGRAKVPVAKSHGDSAALKGSFQTAYGCRVWAG